MYEAIAFEFVKIETRYIKLSMFITYSSKINNR